MKLLAAIVLSLALLSPSLAASAPMDHSRRAAQWNAFAAALLDLHRGQVADQATLTEERIGGYAGYPGFYREVSHFDSASKRLLSRVQWERERPDTLHAIEVFIHDRQGRIVRDYSASYLPQFHNAPMQALVNLHGYNDGLEAFRQFDASGELLYEQCRGNDVSGPVNLALEPWDLPYQPGNGGNEASLAAYNRCFETVPRTATRYLDPRVELAAAAGRDPETTRRTTDPHARIADLGQRIDGGLDDAALLVERGDAYFQVREFELAVIDYDSALRLDDGLDAAYFGRGMALGRMGRIDAGIADLTTYIERQPQSSVAYTKRGIRHFWNGDHDRAEHDFLQALELDPGNAEAHDDLGVILALRGDRKDALTHFHAAIRLEPEYQKAHHNLALVLHMEGREAPALAAVDNALALRPEARESLQLKGAILAGLGRDTEARIINERAANLPEADWSERAQLR